MPAAWRPEGGFTLLEMLVSLAIMSIGLLGVMALHTTVNRSSQLSQQLGRATLLAEARMEELRARSVTEVQGSAGTEATVTEGNVSYVVTHSVATNVGGNENLVLVTVDVTFGEEGDEEGAERTAKLQMLRTVEEML